MCISISYFMPWLCCLWEVFAQQNWRQLPNSQASGNMRDVNDISIPCAIVRRRKRMRARGREQVRVWFSGKYAPFLLSFPPAICELFCSILSSSATWQFRPNYYLCMYHFIYVYEHNNILRLCIIHTHRSSLSHWAMSCWWIYCSWICHFAFISTWCCHQCHFNVPFTHSCGKFQCDSHFKALTTDRLVFRYSIRGAVFVLF